MDTDLEERLLGVLLAVHSNRTTRKERQQALAVYTRALARGQLFSFNDITEVGQSPWSIAPKA